MEVEFKRYMTGARQVLSILTRSNPLMGAFSPCKFWTNEEGALEQEGSANGSLEDRVLLNPKARAATAR